MHYNLFKTFVMFLSIFFIINSVSCIYRGLIIESRRGDIFRQFVVISKPLERLRIENGREVDIVYAHDGTFWKLEQHHLSRLYTDVVHLWPRQQFIGIFWPLNKLWLLLVNYSWIHSEYVTLYRYFLASK